MVPIAANSDDCLTVEIDHEAAMSLADPAIRVNRADVRHRDRRTAGAEPVAGNVVQSTDHIQCLIVVIDAG
jgi:hypothetical protein